MWSVPRAPRPVGESYRQADIILTDQPEVTLFMRFADCVPILVHDPRNGMVGVAHAGWMGTLRDVATTTVNAMTKNYGSNPADIVAGIGPSIGPDHYEIGADVILQVMQKYGDESELRAQVPQWENPFQFVGSQSFAFGTGRRGADRSLRHLHGLSYRGLVFAPRRKRTHRSLRCIDLFTVSHTLLRAESRLRLP